MKFNFFNSLNQLIIYPNQGFSFEIFIDEFSGRVFYRDKTSFIFKISHTSIRLGKDIYGRVWYIHTHIETGKAVLATEEEVARGKELFLSDEVCINSPREVINDSLNAVLIGEKYDVFFENCQHLTSSVCLLKKESRDVSKIAVAGVGTVAGGAMIFKAKNPIVKLFGFAILVGSIDYGLQSSYTEEPVKKVA